jgi:hypothetical protein
MEVYKNNHQFYLLFSMNFILLPVYQCAAVVKGDQAKGLPAKRESIVVIVYW